MPTSKKPKASKAESKSAAVKPRAKASTSSSRTPTPPEVTATEAPAPKRASRSKAKTAVAVTPTASTGDAALVTSGVEVAPLLAPVTGEAPAMPPVSIDDEIATPGASAPATPEVAPTKTPRSRRKTAVAASTPVAPVGPAAPAYDLATREPAADAAHLPRDIAALLSIGREVLGIKNFRAGQVEAYTELLAGHDVLAVMPTGSGKSLLYQLPSLILPGLTVVVSPLIALIKDQIDKMVAKGVAAVRIDSTLTVKQRREVDALVQSPGGKLLLTTPERMADPEFRAFLRTAAGNVGVSRFVVDEAHCVSQWGHDFRPAYLSMRKALEDVGRPPVLATTATAPPHVREDILFQLGIADAKTVTTTFDRPNLHYEVIVFHDEDEKLRTLVTLLKKLPRPGIVYCATVKKVEDLHESLGRWGIPVARYHGRMTKNERDAEQQRFMDSKDIVMVATNAFGLGIDKQDIRNVLHYHVPGSLEAYAQEAGRGGRDGKPARCVLLFSPDDVAIQEYFLSGSYPTRRQVRAVYDTLEAFGAMRGNQADDTQPTIANISLSAGVGSQRTRTVLSLLKDEKFIVEREGGMFYIADPAPSQEQLTERARQYEARRIADRRRLDALLAYVKAPGCRNQVILDYLGEPDAPACGRCDNCLRSKEARLAASNEAASLGATVMRRLDDDGAVIEPVKKVVRARTIRIDAPPADNSMTASAGAAPLAKAGPVVVRRQANAAGGPGASAGPTSGQGPATGPTVLRRPPAAQPESASDRSGVRGPAQGPAAMVRRAAQVSPSITGERAAQSGASGPQAPRAPQDERTAAPLTRIAPLAAPAGQLTGGRPAATSPITAKPPGEHPDEFEDDDDDDDDLDDEDDDDLDDEDDDDDLDDEEDDDLDDEDDDDLDDEDDDDLDDEDDDDLDDEDDDDYELIEKTAAELAEEGIEGTGEVTVLARKRVPKAPKQRVRPDYTNPKDAEAAAEARRRRRRRRRKRRAMLPPKSAFSTPVLVAGELRGKHGSGPVIEYVRSPLRVGPSPVASANPNDAGTLRAGRRKKRSRWERRVDQERQQSSNANAGAPNAERRRRRRRRRRPGLEGNNPPMLGAPQAHTAQGAPGNFAGDDGGPRKRRRRRRRGRGGRNRWQGGPGGPGGESNNGQGGAPNGGAGPAS